MMKKLKNYYPIMKNTRKYTMNLKKIRMLII